VQSHKPKKIQTILPIVILLLFLLMFISIFVKNNKTIFFKVPQITETSLGKVRGGFIHSSTLSPDSRNFAYSAFLGTKAVVVKNGKPGPLFDAVVRDSITFSPDSSRLAYFAGRTRKVMLGRHDDELIAVIDGVTGPIWHKVGDIIFSPNSKRIAYIAAQRSSGPYSTMEWYVIENGEKVGPWDTLVDNSVVFSPDSEYLGFAGKKNGKFKIWIEGQEEDGAGNLVFSPNGQRHAFVRQVEQGWCVVENNRPGPIYELIGNNSIIFSPDSRRIAYAAKSLQGWCIVLDGCQGKNYDSVELSLVFSANSQHLACVAERDQSKFVVIDGVEYPNCYEVAFSPDSNRFALFSMSSPKSGQPAILIDNVEYKGPAFFLTFSPNSKKIAYVSAKSVKGYAQFHIGVNGVLGQPFSRVKPPVFSPDSQHIAHLAVRDNKWLVLVDGNEVNVSYDEIFEDSQIVFDSTSQLHFISQQGDEAKLVKITLP
jgi:WD40 repeat protein